MNLVIGNTSQLSKYFPEDYIKVSSRNIDINILNQYWDTVYITHAKQNVFDEIVDDFLQTNTFDVLSMIDILLMNGCNKIVVYTTCEIFNNINGGIDINTIPSFKPHININYTNYTLSKFLLYKNIELKRNINKLWNKVIIIHPFHFESFYKNQYFLFGKITDSIINKKHITLNNLNFYRDIIHTKHVVDMSIKAVSDMICGSGTLYHMHSLVKQIYDQFDMDINDYVTINDTIMPDKKINYNSMVLNNSFLSDYVEEIKRIYPNKV